MIKYQWTLPRFLFWEEKKVKEEQEQFLLDNQKKDIDQKLTVLTPAPWRGLQRLLKNLKDPNMQTRRWS